MTRQADRITDKQRLEYVLSRSKMTPIFAGHGPSKRRVSWGFRITIPFLGYATKLAAIDAAIRAQRRGKR